MFNELRDLDFNDIGSAPVSVRYVILGFLLVIILAIGYFLLIKAKTEQLEVVQIEGSRAAGGFREQAGKGGQSRSVRSAAGGNAGIAGNHVPATSQQEQRWTNCWWMFPRPH